MVNERNIGHIVAVDSLSVFVRLDDDLRSLYKSGYEEIYPVARINSYIIIPVGADRIVALVDRVMNREETNLTKSQGSIFLTESSRYLSATMIGTIDGGQYIQGVYNYPILDNPVWYVTRKDLDIIFDHKTANNGKINFREDFYLPIGTSPSFPDYDVKINPDRMFGKHLAILGNTGSGKSCTLTSLLQSMFKFEYNSQKLQSSHIVIFDTNGEYKDAFSINNRHKVNPFHINEDGLKVPYWFMNFDDMDYLFEPTTGTQAPILKRAIGLAKSQVIPLVSSFIGKNDISLIKSFLQDLTGSDNVMKKALYERAEYIKKTIEAYKEGGNIAFDLTQMITGATKLVEAKSKLIPNGGFINGIINYDKYSEGLRIFQEELSKYEKSVQESISADNRSVDIPLYFSFDSLLTEYIDSAIREQSVSTDKLNEYISTLLLRMRSYVDDVRLATPLKLNKQEEIKDALIQFLAFILGDYCSLYNIKEYEGSSFHNYYTESFGNDVEKMSRNQVTIIDMSLLPFQVLETITGLIGRLILEFMSRFEKNNRGNMPVVIVLEEAQNYIPEVNRKDRESISKKVFERIAREGRKYGLSLVVSSQRPSELSKTVLSQCNSFIVHRIQNPEDQSYIRKLVSSANSEILNQLPTLPQQHVIIMGDCVRTPTVARMNDANPRPNSNNPRFIENWLKDDMSDYIGVSNKWMENEKDFIGDVDVEKEIPNI